LLGNNGLKERPERNPSIFMGTTSGGGKEKISLKKSRKS
jgi:hypothetical protein